MKIHHVGCLVKNMREAMEEMRRLGWVAEGDVYRDEPRGIDICFLENGGQVVELVSPFSGSSAIGGLHKKVGNSPYHICYEVSDLEAAAEELRKRGYIPTTPIEPAGAIHNQRVLFLLNRHIGLIELLEVKNE